jgi:arylsulfatase A
MKRREFVKSISLVTAALSFPLFSCDQKTQKPNIIYILADDLGYGELGCYGQRKIRTPNIDKLAVEGMRFTQHYSGSPVCAPSRCTLMTGLHTGHSYIRRNDEAKERGDVWHDPNLEGQRPIPEDAYTIGKMLQKVGYETGAVGKWGLGWTESSGAPNKQGFDFFYGYICQREAHNYYPTHLWKNEKKDMLTGNKLFSPHQKLPKGKDANEPDTYKPYKGKQYAMDNMAEEAIEFIKRNKEKQFFLYLPFPVPHMAMQVPDDSLQEYEGLFPEIPYKGQRGYLPHAKPRAAYAAMITRMDRELGKIVDLVQRLKLDNNTLIIFTSDNGTAGGYGGTDPEFFSSSGGLKNYKGSVYEGGIRVPMIARWKGNIQPGSVTDHISAFWDVMPTLSELCDADCPENIDGISFLATLLGKKKQQKKHEYLYWEHLQKMQAVRKEDWKGVRLSPQQEIELYNLNEDIGESNNVADTFPDIVEKMKQIMIEGRTESKIHPLRWDK